MTTLSQRLRDHVTSRGGQACDANGKPVCPNGAWQLMLDAADEIERLNNEVKEYGKIVADNIGTMRRASAKLKRL